MPEIKEGLKMWLHSEYSGYSSQPVYVTKVKKDAVWVSPVKGYPHGPEFKMSSDTLSYCGPCTDAIGQLELHFTEESCDEEIHRRHLQYRLMLRIAKPLTIEQIAHINGLLDSWGDPSRTLDTSYLTRE